jgi:type 2 lantibiotic biosynthesis protein LanM
MDICLKPQIDMDNQTIYLVKNELEAIPFVDIILPYTQIFLDELEEKNTSIELVNKLHATLLQELSLVAEVTLQEELDYFKTNGQNFYQEFIEKANLFLPGKYPVLDKMLKTTASNYLLHIQNIFSNFSKDFNLIVKSFSITANKNNIIKDIDTSLGDGHSGESTALVTLSDGTKLIYKPRNIDTATSYNLFIDWVNHKLKTNLKTLKSVSCGSYGWLEFVTYKPVNSSDELQEYYYQTGMLLAVTLLLGSKDCHYENVIASGKNPVIIDHETIIQPLLSSQSIRTWDEQHKVPPFSVLESMLIANRNTGVPLECAGFGIKGNIEAMDLEKKVINPNTIDSKRDTRFIFRKLIKENIPVYNDTHVFANNYKDSFTEGFSATYDMFMDSIEELMSCSSPIRFFENQNIRYVWRPTFIYFRILKYMKGASFMSNFETYGSKLYELMSKAYQKENFKNYKFILDCEMKQMLNGDIPFFNLNSLDCHLEEVELFKIFRYNCIENIRHRIGLLSVDHKKEQLEYITKWLNT